VIDGRSVSQSVSQSVRLGIEPISDSRRDFCCSQDSYSIVMRRFPDGRTGLSGNKVKVTVKVKVKSLCFN
jgi:hypothetical protein